MGGHSLALIEDTGDDVQLLGIDRDPVALDRARERLASFENRVQMARGSFRGLATIARDHNVLTAQSILLDLGMSSYQVDESGRGFSFQRDEPLDMRFDPASGLTAADLLNELDEAEIARILFEYGEEPHARRIARAIVRRRPLVSTGDLVAAVRSGVPRMAWPKRLHVATKTFLALRMAVNDEPAALREVLPAAAALLDRGGRLGVISFHSGEDRIVKQTFRSLAAERDAESEFEELEPSPVTPGDDEIRANPRARSAKLRVLERLS